MMLGNDRERGIIEITCLQCGNKLSTIKYNEGGSEYGECTKCGNTTYRKMSPQEKADIEARLSVQYDQESKNAYKNKIQTIKDEMTNGISKPTIKCPYCNSTNTTKITFSKKLGKTFLWGFAAAGTITKEWHCKNCKSDF